MPVHLNHDLEKLKKKILEFSADIDRNLARAIKAMRDSDEQLASIVVDHDHVLDRTEVEIEDDCLKILALHQPVARDLRYVVTVLKMNNDLERIGDFAVNIAQRTIYLARHQPIALPPEIFDMATKARAMVTHSLDSLVKGDSALARKVCADDDEVDSLGRDLYRIIRTAFQENPGHISEWMQLFQVIRYVERVGDLATNIAEDVIYLVEGEVVRHRNLDVDV
jgi:phosphate transport system protein